MTNTRPIVPQNRASYVAERIADVDLMLPTNISKEQNVQLTYEMEMHWKVSL
jgi:hypothetical protein